MQEHNNRKVLAGLFAVAFGLILVVALAVPVINSNAVRTEISHPDSNVHAFIFFAVIAFTIAGLIFAFHQERNYRKQKQDLGEYIAECERRGYSISEISDILAKKGWIKKDIERFL